MCPYRPKPTGFSQQYAAAIPPGRLQANPLARRCLACRQKAQGLYGAKDATPRRQK